MIISTQLKVHMDIFRKKTHFKLISWIEHNEWSKFCMLANTLENIKFSFHDSRDHLALNRT